MISIDGFRYEEAMMSGSGRVFSDESAVLCERCGSACDRRCRADELARQTLDQLLRQGWRLA
jgi:hypothetical protein